MDLIAVLILVPGVPVAVLLARRLHRRSAWWVAALVAAAVSAWALLLVDRGAALPSFAILAATWGAATAVDLAEHRLPDVTTLAPFPIFYLLQLPWLLTTGEWSDIAQSVVGALVTATLLFVLAYINPNGFGLGDVKLGLTTGAALGGFGVGTALLGLGAAFILMALISGLLLITKRITREAEIAFGPFMVLGVLVTPSAASLLGW